MTDTYLTDLLERAADHSHVGPAPLNDVVEGATRRRRRHRARLSVVMSAAAIIVAIGGGGFITALDRDSNEQPSPTSSSGPTPSTTDDAEGLSLPCPTSDQQRVDLDVLGPGRPSPQEAVAPYVDGRHESMAVTEQDQAAIVYVQTADGTVTQVFKARKRIDGWWPDSYSECVR